MTNVASYASSLNSLLEGMLARVPGARHGVLTTVDGIAVATSARLAERQAQELATIGASLLSISTGAGVRLDTGAVRHAVVDMQSALLLAAPISTHVMITVVAAPETDRERLGFEVGQFAGRATPLVAGIH